MLGDALVKTFGFIASSLGNIVSSIAPSTMIPQIVPTAINKWAEIVEGISGMSHWLPMGVISQVVIGLLFAHTIALGVRITRIILSAGIGGGG